MKSFISPSSIILYRTNGIRGQVVGGGWMSSGICYTGWPNKNGTAYFPQYVDAITGISVRGNFF